MKSGEYAIHYPINWGVDPRGKSKAKKAEREMMSVANVLSDNLELGKVTEYRIVEKDGRVYRMSKDNEVLGSIPKEKYLRMKKIREELGWSIKTSERKITQKQSNLDKEIND